VFLVYSPGTYDHTDMLRALLRVGQRAARIQLEQTKAVPSAVRATEPTFRVPNGGIPGYWVEKPTFGTREGLIEEGRVGMDAARNTGEVGKEKERIVDVFGERSTSKDTAKEDVPVRHAGEALPISNPKAALEIQVEPETTTTAPRVPTTTASSLTSDASVESQDRTTASEPAQDSSPPVVEPLQTETRSPTTVTKPGPIESQAEAKPASPQATPVVEPESDIPEVSPEVRIEEPSTDSKVEEMPSPSSTVEVNAELDDVEQRPVRLTILKARTVSHTNLCDSLKSPSVQAPSRALESVEFSITAVGNPHPTCYIQLTSLRIALVAGMSLGAAGEVLRRSTGQSSQGSVFMSEANIRRLVDKLSKMRGAALKLGQFMSIQGMSCDVWSR
jgi:hypothetical protein